MMNIIQIELGSLLIHIMITSQEVSIVEDSKDLFVSEDENSFSKRLTYSKIIAYSTTGILILLCFYSIYFAKAILFPLTLAIFLNLLLSPIVRSLKKFGMPYSLGSVGILGGFIFAITVLIFSLVEPASYWLNQAPRSVSIIEKKLSPIKKPIEDLSKATDKISAVTDIQGKTVKAVVYDSNKNTLVQAVSLAGSSLSEIILSLILTFFLLSSGDRFLTKLIQVTPGIKDKKKIVEVSRAIEKSVSQYLVYVVTINILLAILVAIAMYFLKVPNPILWGAMAGLLNFIPYLGSILGLTIVSVVSIMTFDSLSEICMVPIMYAVIDWFEGVYISPKLLGRKFDLNPLIVLFWIILWCWLWGAWGGIIAVPMLIMIKVLCDNFEKLQVYGRFLTR